MSVLSARALCVTGALTTLRCSWFCAQMREGRGEWGSRGRVTDLAFHPTDALAVTTSDCGEFKIWTQAGGPDDYFDENDASSGREPGAGQDSDPSTWCCRSVGSFRGSIPTHFLSSSIPFCPPPPFFPALLLFSCGLMWLIIIVFRNSLGTQYISFPIAGW